MRDNPKYDLATMSYTSHNFTLASAYIVGSISLTNNLLYLMLHSILFHLLEIFNFELRKQIELREYFMKQLKVHPKGVSGLAYFPGLWAYLILEQPISSLFRAYELELIDSL